MTGKLLEAEGLRKAYPNGRESLVHAAQDVSLSLDADGNLGLVGPEGSGKSIVAKMLTGLLPPDRGAVLLEGTNVYSLDRKELRRAQGRIPLIPQDRRSVMPPRARVGRVLDEPLDLFMPEHEQRWGLVISALAAVTLPSEVAEMRVGKLSPLERALVALARALILRPRIVVADELTQSLDHHQAGEVVQLMTELGLLHGVSYVFVTRNLAIAEFLCDHLVVMDAGRVVDQGRTEQVVARPLHPSSVTLVADARRQQAG